MNTELNQKIVDEICDYAEKYQIKDLLKEYLTRLALHKPEDPMKFLLNSITENPFVISSLSSSQDSVDSSTRKPLIVIYQGVASPVESQHFTALENLLNKRFEIVKAGDATDIDITTAINNYNPVLFIHPGGCSDIKAGFDAISVHKNCILKYIENGGRYLSLGSAAYFMGPEGFNLLNNYEIVPFQPTEEQKLVEIKFINDKIKVFRENGVYFKVIDDNFHTAKIHSTFLSDEICSMVLPVGKGFLALSSVHFEAPLEWVKNLEGSDDFTPQSALFLNFINSLCA